jgi:hypothetical protein
MVQIINILLVVVLLFLSCEKKKESTDFKIPPPWNMQTTQLDPNPWTVKASVRVEDTAHVLGVIYHSEMWTTDTARCMIVFENTATHEYKLVAPWIKVDMIIQKNNLLTDQIIELPRK